MTGSCTGACRFASGCGTAYLRRLVEAHHLHHAVRGREGCVSFGFLYAPPLPVLRERLKVAKADG